ncbi:MULTISPECIES: N-acetylmuramoyl-L-alanine amidase family protein [unclassified Rhizobium]|uniref:peptidoglycan recognition protein family protein n=1 Tax=unclassified Rhizobium TaxID=2613769 RepID=UPI000BC389B5|nr:MULTISPECIES: N-acetylmuramoyl-L-alanine amidase [unclassified Rhizobium]MDH7810095.1 N-acetylmuramoyl-L-alanine amidase [Rhizobium sp. AN67]MDQ4409102.1 N-acetylmuramoyl-L-alanine amidase [Rhizobium sp. AN63]SOD51085.1 N-acetylmuramoyl-L-alanine amidase [Rhizobium sp. AN6A]
MDKAVSSEVTKDFIPVGRPNRPGNRISPTSVTIHNTDNSRKGANAKAHSKFLSEVGSYVHNGETIKCSWHFTVDDQFVIQHLPLTEKAWHAGAAANSSSIGIEICMNSDNDQALANRRAAGLVAGILKEFGWKINAVKQHNFWTGKNCPSVIRGSKQWEEFLASVSQALDSDKPFVSVDANEAGVWAGQWLDNQNEADDGTDIDHEPLNDAVNMVVDDK